MKHLTASFDHLQSYILILLPETATVHMVYRTLHVF